MSPDPRSDAPPPRSAADLVPAAYQRYIPALTAIAIGVALFGFLRGISERTTPLRTGVPESEAATVGAPAAVTYQELAAANWGRNRTRTENLNELKYPKPGYFDPVVRTEAMKSAALAERSLNRAYDGAPPTIPHPIDQHEANNCLACHAEGLKVDNRLAAKISHAHFSNCTQCHVEQNRSGLQAASEPSANSFTGLLRAGPGTRASLGAPPTIPHTTWLREECMSCHGLLARPGLRTTHPWLSNCTQCHAASAEREQLDFLRTPEESSR